MQELIKAMKALSDETRLRMLNVLMERECCVCEIIQALNVSQTRASRNLGILKEAGFLKSRREGLWMLYSIDWSGANRYASSLARLIKESTVRHDVLTEDRKRLKKAQRPGTAKSKRKLDD
jgi:ArsR family transcriptional regulator